MTPLSQRVGVVTGAGRGLGRAHALALAKAGARLVVNDVGCELDGTGSEGSLATELVREIEAGGGEAVANADPVGEPEIAQALVDLAVERFGRLDFLVNNAGISQSTRLVDLDSAVWERILGTHLGGTYTCAQAAFRAMANQGEGGRIINTTSGAGLGRAYPGAAAYASAKGAIAAFTRVVAAEGKEHGIACNAISPLARTRMSGSFLSGSPDGGGTENAAALVVYLASEASAAITGQIFRVAQGRLGVYETSIPEGCAPLGEHWTAEEIAARIDEVLALPIDGRSPR